MSRRNAERGSTLIMITLALTTLMGLLGLVVDVGWAYFRKQAAQAAADAAVLSAAAASTQSATSFTCGLNGIACQDPTSCGTDIPNPPTTNLQVGCLYAKQNGFSASTGQTVLISAKTTSSAPGAPGVQVPYWISVSISEKNAQTFSRIFGNTFMNVGATATATVFPAPGDCIYALSGTGVGLSQNGNTAVSTQCGVYIDSTSSGALTIDGGNANLTVTGADVDIVGSYYAQNGGSVSPTPKTGVGAASDPLQFMPTPTAGTCSSGVTLTSHQSQTISQGCYSSLVSAGGQSSLTLNPGTYIFQGGLNVGGQASLSGSGVTLYVSGGSVSIAGGGAVSLSAPISGAYLGVTIFQDKSNTNALSLVGGTNQVISGAVYAPKANINYTGGATGTSLSTLIIGNTISFVGNSNITAASKTSYSGGAGGVTLIQ